LSEAGRLSRFNPSVVAPVRTAIGAWHFTQKSPMLPSRCPRAFIATNSGSSEA
jgi:hypothetical protein